MQGRRRNTLLPSRLETSQHSRKTKQDWALEEQRNGEWRYLKFLQVTSLAHPGHQGKHQPPGP